MPFVPFYPRKFSSASVAMHAPALPGVYGISNARQWVYIGETDDIRAALVKHLAAGDPSVRGFDPTGFVFEVCSASDRLARHNRLIAEYGPAGNRRPN